MKKRVQMSERTIFGELRGPSGLNLNRYKPGGIMNRRVENTAPGEERARDILIQMLVRTKISERLRSCLLFRDSDSPRDIIRVTQAAVEVLKPEDQFTDLITTTSKLAAIAKSFLNKVDGFSIYAKYALEILKEYHPEAVLHMNNSHYQASDMRVMIKDYMQKSHRNPKYISPVAIGYISTLLHYTIYDEITELPPKETTAPWKWVDEL